MFLCNPRHKGVDLFYQVTFSVRPPCLYQYDTLSNNLHFNW